MRPTCGWGGWRRVLLAGGIVLHYLRLAGAHGRNAHRALRRSLRLDVAFRVAFGSHLSGAGIFPPPAFGGLARLFADAGLDGGARLAGAARNAGAAPGARTAVCVSRDAEIWAYAAFALSFVLSRVYLVQDRMLRSTNGRAILAFPGAGSAGAHVAKQRVHWAAALAFGVGQRAGVAAPADGHLRWGDPKEVVTLVIVGVYVGVSVAFAQCGMARSARGDGLRAEFCHRAVQLHAREFISHPVHRFF